MPKIISLRRKENKESLMVLFLLYNQKLKITRLIKRISITKYSLLNFSIYPFITLVITQNGWKFIKIIDKKLFDFRKGFLYFDFIDIN